MTFRKQGRDGLTWQRIILALIQGMADQIIENMPKESTRSVLKYGAIFSGIVIFYRLLSDFASQAVLVLKPLAYLTDIILVLARKRQTTKQTESLSQMHNQGVLPRN